MTNALGSLVIALYVKIDDGMAGIAWLRGTGLQRISGVLLQDIQGVSRGVEGPGRLSRLRPG
ncbi:hypothetical protein [Actinomadura rubrisoli]|uniref:Uncharacterized protein n=1 Tax=Actinomadura rubrisoli TaxID=2530368 RepID=A0A4R5A4U2_9ACTN|nr:hypothetical protein [Actinomadura rubrisoli]TDD66080.1 hypothetical protein E1298_40715 [Actinomadura rubrisoli]